MNASSAKFFAFPARCLGFALALLMVVKCGAAEPTGGGRWLLIFDTSATMKKRLPATETALEQLLYNSANGQMESGDSVAVWTFGDEINSQFPVSTWNPSHAAAFKSSLVNYLKKQRYRRTSHLAILETPLKHVVAGSRRLTIIIFTDGQSEMTGTPYDQGINQTIRQTQEERKKNRQPYAILMRTQFGQFVGCTLNFPPGNFDFPAFPPVPPPPVPVPAPIVATQPKPVVATQPPVVPALVIVGTNVGTNVNITLPEPAPELVPSPITKPEAKKVEPPVPPAPAVTNVTATVTNPPTAQATPASNSVPVTSSTTPKDESTNVAASESEPSNTAATEPTPAPSNSPENAVFPQTPQATNSITATTNSEVEPPSKALIYIGMALLGAALTLIVVLIVRASSRPKASLITSSMRDHPDRKP